MRKIMITGAAGLVGTALVARLHASGYALATLDRSRPWNDCGFGDIVDAHQVAERVRGCSGIVHLAAVSRVAWGERDPERCWATNVEGTRNVLRAAAAAASTRPWVLFASSREVYGDPSSLPVAESAPLAPVNVYGRSKLEGEKLVMQFKEAGLRAAIVRLANVYGTTADHPDRVVPAFCRAAAAGSELRVAGGERLFDFTQIDDVVEGLMALVAKLEAGEGGLPPVHLVTGRGTTLLALARLAIEAGGGRAPLREMSPQSYDVTRFVGDPQRARELLGWEARIPVAEGVERLVRAFAAQNAAPQATDGLRPAVAFGS